MPETIETFTVARSDSKYQLISPLTTNFSPDCAQKNTVQNTALPLAQCLLQTLKLGEFFRPGFVGNCVLRERHDLQIREQKIFISVLTVITVKVTVAFSNYSEA